MEEVIGIIAVCVILPSILTQAFVSVRKAKYEAQARAGSGEGLRASELQRLIREAVEDAVEPLHARIDALEGPPTGADGAAGAPRLDPAVLADALETDLDEDGEVAAVRRRTRL